jgi:hypothetical protein
MSRASQPAPGTLDEVRAIRDPESRLRAVVAYLAKLEDRKREALQVRDAAIRAVKAGPTEVARMTGLSVSTVKLARSRPR